MQYESFSMPNGLRIIYMPVSSPVSYCGFAINAGARDEGPHQFGLAHFVEHMLFKGTKKRKSWHILNRMEVVGGELNAYTTKEETFLYSISLSEDTERAIELLSDLIFHSQFPETEIKREKEVINDEINSYKDNPSELIFDEFENLLFSGNEIGHNILGDENSLKSFTSSSCKSFINSFYTPENMVFFYLGKTPLKKIKRLADRYLLEKRKDLSSIRKRTAPPVILPVKEKIDKELHQSHVIIGSRGYDYHNKKRLGLYLLNNLLGGPGMNSRLNISLREKNGLVYTVESSLSSYSDTGVFSIYFGTEHESTEKCIRLVNKELKKLRENELTTSQFHSAVKQMKGQLGISCDQKENIALSMGKSFLHFNKYDSLQEVYQKLDSLNPQLLLEIANEILDEDKLFQLVYR